jgi:hypothetical protein
MPVRAITMRLRSTFVDTYMNGAMAARFFVVQWTDPWGNLWYDKQSLS